MDTVKEELSIYAEQILENVLKALRVADEVFPLTDADYRLLMRAIITEAEGRLAMLEDSIAESVDQLLADNASISQQAVLELE